MSDKIPITIELSREALEFLQLTGEVATCDLSEVVDHLAAEAQRRGWQHPGKLLAESRAQSRIGPVTVRIRRNRHGYALTEAVVGGNEITREEATAPEELYDLIDRPHHSEIRAQLKSLLVAEKQNELRAKLAARRVSGL